MVHCLESPENRRPESALGLTQAEVERNLIVEVEVDIRHRWEPVAPVVGPAGEVTHPFGPQPGPFFGELPIWDDKRAPFAWGGDCFLALKEKDSKAAKCPALPATILRSDGLRAI